MNSGIDDILKKSIQCIKGVAEKRSKLFHRLGVFSVYDLITFFPRGYEDRSKLKKISQMENGEECTFEGIVISKVAERRIRRGLSIYQMYVKDDTGTVMITWFNQSFVKKVFNVGEHYIFFGKVIGKFKYFEVSNPVYEKVGSGEYKNTMRILPVYSSTAGLSQNTIRTVMENALELVVGKLEESIPDGIRKEYCLCEINYAFSNIHFQEVKKI